MKVPYNWLREYVDIPYPPEELARRLTMAGIEVGSVQIFAPLGEGFVAGRIEELSPHPTASNLQVVRLMPENGILNIVCGAWNIKKGTWCPGSSRAMCRGQGDPDG